MLRLNNLKTRIAMNEKIPVFVICVKAIIYLLLYNLLYFIVCYNFKACYKAILQHAVQ